MSSNAPIQPSRTIVVLTVSQLEFEAVCKQLGQTSKEALLGHNRTPLPFSVRLGDFEGYSVVVVCSYQSGNQRIKTAMMAAMYQYQPCLAIFVGVGGGVGMDIGSVVISDHIADHTYTVEDKDGTSSFNVKGGSVHAQLIPYANQVRHEDAWVKRIQTPPIEAKEALSKQVVVGTIGAGNVKVTSETGPTAKMLATAGANTHAIDMESAACYDLADTATPKLPFIAIRGISDRLSDKDIQTDKYRQPWAAAHASAVAFEFMHLFVSDLQLPASTSPATKSAASKAPKPVKRSRPDLVEEVHQKVLFGGGELAGQSCDVHFRLPEKITLQVGERQMWSTYHHAKHMDKEGVLNYGHGGTSPTKPKDTEATPIQALLKGTTLVGLEVDYGSIKDKFRAISFNPQDKALFQAWASSNKDVELLDIVTAGSVKQKDTLIFLEENGLLESDVDGFLFDTLYFEDEDKSAVRNRLKELGYKFHAVR